MQTNNTDSKVIVDALGNSVVIGDIYGYTTSSSGWQEVVQAEAVSVNEHNGTVSLKNGTVKKYLYGEFNCTDLRPKSKIRGFMLFPVKRN